MVYSRAEHVFILQHYFALKSFDAVCETISNAYPDKEVPSKITVLGSKLNVKEGI
jgi:hypothetical protein